MTSVTAMTSHQLDRALRQALADLDLIAAGPCARLDSNGTSSDPTGLPTTTGSSADPYRRRLAGINTSYQRRMDATDTIGDTTQRDNAAATAWQWRHQARTSVLTAARAEYAQLTGRTGSAPERRAAKLDTDQGIRQIIEQDAPGKPADDLATRLGVSKFIVRRVYNELELDPVDGTPRGNCKLNAEDRRARVARLHDQGVTGRQMAQLLDVTHTTIQNDLAAIRQRQDRAA